MDDGDVSGCKNERKKDGEMVEKSEININNNSNSEKNVEISAATASIMFPGFRFCPTDEELISYYLKKKVEGSDNCGEVISEVEIWKHEPWDLPAQSIIQSDNEWFFFSPRGRKYPNGSQSKRATESGYWKATGKERNVKSGSNMIGTKRTLVFHIGRAPKGQRTQWIMHEYCMTGNSNDQDSMVVCRLRKNNEFHLNDTPGNQRNHLAVNDTAALSGAGQLDGLGLISGVACCSKVGSSSYSSHSVEQIESGSESDKLTKELPQHHSSSDLKDCDEEDCFADILKDDIVKLDDSSYKARNNLLPTIARKLESSTNSPMSEEAQNLMSHRLPFQGTANRRLKLRTENVPRQVEKSKPHEANKKISHGRGISRQLIKRMKQWLICLLLVSLMLLVMFLCLFGVPQQSKMALLQLKLM
ncbi:NAC domain-containing protein 40 [Lycium ferocissimum]|uniref:NAC domain-containing protein 40 n=1 Tax=Lycium ferocissimum TaxID=112874 RepID=UPI0028150652|nr:NAC domain-containing protein 40 [Lycium ferocissimum]